MGNTKIVNQGVAQGSAAQRQPPPEPSDRPQDWFRRINPALALFLLASVSLLVIWPFLPSLAWASIVAYASWPVYKRLRGGIPGPVWVSALLMTLAVACILLLPVLWLGWYASVEVTHLLTWVGALARDPPTLPSTLSELPWVGPWLTEEWAYIVASPEEPLRHLRDWLTANVRGALALAGGLGRTVAKIVLFLLILLFVFKDGERVMQQVHALLDWVLGRSADQYLEAAGNATRGVIFGIIVSAIAQGALAGVGYWAFGLPSPATLVLITIVMALIPFGAVLVWGAASIWLLSSGQVWAAAGLIGWGVAVVSQIDNVVRPIVISETARVPFIPVLFGVLGGLLAFGLVGMFLGPVVLAVSVAVWREWATHLESLRQDATR